MTLVSEETRPARVEPDKTPFLISAVLMAVALAVLYAPLWSACWAEWWREGSYYSHGILIPPLALLMAWHRREALREVETSRAPAALAALFLGLALQLAARWAHSTLL